MSCEALVSPEEIERRIDEMTHEERDTFNDLLYEIENNPRPSEAIYHMIVLFYPESVT